MYIHNAVEKYAKHAFSRSLHSVGHSKQDHRGDVMLGMSL